MPISEDEFDSRSVQEPRITMSKAELRKTHKPIMEKRRRARINHCLNEIKSLVLEALNKDPSRHSKLEKADILEMAVKHLQTVQRQQLAIGMATDPSVVRKFKAGFNDCADEIDKCLNQLEGVGNSLKQGLSHHLRKCINGIEQATQMNFPDKNQIPFLSNINAMSKFENVLESTNSRDDANNNPYFRIPQTLQLFPEKIKSGDLNLLLSNVANYNLSNSTSQIRVKETHRPSAFAAVIPSTLSTKLLSPPLSPDNHQISEDRSSPRGFRPVHKPASTYFSMKDDEHQVCQISSTSTSSVPEIKTVKFPIQSFLEKKVYHNHTKIAEPLCIITNQNERFKQAQVKEDSLYCEENIQRGVKRKFSETQGLLTTAQDFSKSEKREPPSFSFRINQSSTPNQASNSREQNEDTPEMWRPW